MLVKVSRYLTPLENPFNCGVRRHEVITEKRLLVACRNACFGGTRAIADNKPLKVAPGVKPKGRKFKPSRKVSALPNPGLPENGRSARSPETALPPVHRLAYMAGEGNLISRFGKKAKIEK